MSCSAAALHLLGRFDVFLPALVMVGTESLELARGLTPRRCKVAVICTSTDCKSKHGQNKVGDSHKHQIHALAPDIVESILVGGEYSELSLRDFRKSCSLSPFRPVGISHGSPGGKRSDPVVRFDFQFTTIHSLATQRLADFSIAFFQNVLQ